MSRRWVAAWVAAGAVVVLALLLTSVGDPISLMTPRSPAPAPVRPAVPALPTTTTLTPRPFGTASGEPLGPLSPFVALLVQITAVLVILVVLGVIISLIGSVWRRPQFVTRQSAEFVSPDAPEVLLASAEERLALLSEGEPRNAIVAAWLSLEAAASAAGLPREPSETSTEYTTRVLRTWDIDPRPLADLAGLYREARFSRHPLGEDHRHRAVHDLTTIQDDLHRAAADRANGPGGGPTPTDPEGVVTT